jgi:hypothetical protein
LCDFCPNDSSQFAEGSSATFEGKIHEYAPGLASSYVALQATCW